MTDDTNLTANHAPTQREKPMRTMLRITTIALMLTTIIACGAVTWAAYVSAQPVHACVSQ